MADTGFIGQEPLVTPTKKRQNLEFAYRTAMNRDIRGQRISNEWGVGAISNKWRIFLGRWTFLPEMWPVCYEIAAMLLNWTWRPNCPLVPLERRLRRVEQYEQDDFGFIEQGSNKLLKSRISEPETIWRPYFDLLAVLSRSGRCQL